MSTPAKSKENIERTLVLEQIEKALRYFQFKNRDALLKKGDRTLMSFVFDEKGIIFDMVIDRAKKVEEQTKYTDFEYASKM